MDEFWIWPAFGIIALWLVLVSFWIYKTDRHYSRLLKKTGKADLKSILEKLLTERDKVDITLREIETRIGQISEKSLTHVQKTGLVRFNPFSETGGNQSFALALLNAYDSGIVMLSLHSREGTRVYVKPVKAAASKYDLSREEKQAIEEARKQNIEAISKLSR